MSDKREYQIGDVQMNSGRRRGPGGSDPMVMSGEKAGDFVGSVGKLLRYCGRYLPAIVAASVLVLAGVATSLAGPGLLADLTRVIPQDVRGEVDFEHVGFGYEEGQEVICDFTSHVEPGQKAAIVGPTDAGNSQFQEAA